MHHRRRERRCPPIPALGRQLGLGVIAALIMQSLDNQEQIMASLADLQSAFGTLKGDVTRALADLRDKVDQIERGDLSPANQAIVDDILDQVNALDEAVDTASPEAPTGEPEAPTGEPAEPTGPTEPTDG